jgi:hypothetical protein
MCPLKRARAIFRSTGRVNRKLTRHPRKLSYFAQQLRSAIYSTSLERFNFEGSRWCCRGGLNSRPLPYQGSALPLSYGSMPGIAFSEESAAMASHGRAVLATRPSLAQACQSHGKVPKWVSRAGCRFQIGRVRARRVPKPNEVDAFDPARRRRSQPGSEPAVNRLVRQWRHGMFFVHRPLRSTVVR